MFQECEKIVILTGPTATGKTALAVQLAGKYKGEIISADSRQVYRGLDLGSGKDLAEYGEIPFHLIDIAAPTETYHLQRFLTDCRAAVRAIAGRGRMPIIVGGTALYLNALLSGYTLADAPTDWEERARLDAMTPAELTAELRKFPAAAQEFQEWENKNRIRRAIELARQGAVNGVAVDTAYRNALILGVYFPREEVRRRIALRLEARFEAGMIDEVRRLHDEEGVSWSHLESFGLEYGCIARHLQGKMALEAMKADLLIRIRQFAKRQDIWFRKIEREGRRIHWLTQDRQHKAETLIDLYLTGGELPAPELVLADTFYGPRQTPTSAGAEGR